MGFNSGFKGLITDVTIYVTGVSAATGTLYARPGFSKHFGGRVHKLSKNFEEILSRARGNFEAQNKVLELSIIIVNYCIIMNAHYN